jgi:hypothetical protein
MTGNGLYTTLFMVMTGGWFIIVLPTLLLLIITDISDPQACYRTRSEMKETTGEKNIPENLWGSYIIKVLLGLPHYPISS